MDNPERFLLTSDGASSHKFEKILPWIEKELGLTIPKAHLTGVANTTFATQACDMGIIKD
jgi:hypothetical protein